jgi:hypothetical protein
MRETAWQAFLFKAKERSLGFCSCGIHIEPSPLAVRNDKADE